MSDRETILLAVAGILALAALLIVLLWRWRRARSRAAGPRLYTLSAGLNAARSGLVDKLRRVVSEQGDLELRVRALEETLIAADVGVRATAQLLDGLTPSLRANANFEEVRHELARAMIEVLDGGASGELVAKPHVVIVSGVNGVGKTTSIAKLANLHVKLGRSVLLVAADTFRAAASDQLALWAERAGVDCVRHPGGKDPSAVVFDGMAAATARGVDVVIVDTAGRQHVKDNLIEELKKIFRVIARQVPGAPHESLLVIDATTGQNALSQARRFGDALGLDGIILTKLDGTAKGGVVFAIAAELHLPVRYVGFGEAIDDFAPFDASEFVAALVGAAAAGERQV